MRDWARRRLCAAEEAKLRARRRGCERRDARDERCGIECEGIDERGRSSMTLVVASRCYARSLMVAGRQAGRHGMVFVSVTQSVY